MVWQKSCDILDNCKHYILQTPATQKLQMKNKSFLYGGWQQFTSIIKAGLLAYRKFARLRPYYQGSKANWLNSAILGLTLIISEIRVNLLKKMGGEGLGVLKLVYPWLENDFLAALVIDSITVDNQCGSPHQGLCPWIPHARGLWRSPNPLPRPRFSANLATSHLEPSFIGSAPLLENLW